MYIKDKKIGVTCVMGVLMLSLGLGGCQKHDEPANSISDESIEEAQPMSAEPAETEEVVLVEDTAPSEAMTEVSYSCTPALEVHATYNTAENNVVLDVNNNGLVLTTSAANESPVVYNDEEGITQWRVTQGSQDDMGQAVLRINEDGTVQSYECGAVS